MRRRLFAAWLGVLGLLLQVGLATQHSARHFDHFFQPLNAGHAVARHAAQAAPNAAALPSDDGPQLPGLDHCAVGLGLAASANFVLAEPGLAPVPRSYAMARPDDLASAIATPLPRRSLPPARAPPVIAVFV